MTHTMAPLSPRLLPATHLHSIGLAWHWDLVKGILSLISPSTLDQDLVCTLVFLRRLNFLKVTQPESRKPPQPHPSLPIGASWCLSPLLPPSPRSFV